MILGRSWMRVGWVRVVGFKDDCWREGYTWVRNRLLGSPFIRWGKSLRRQSCWVNDQRRSLGWTISLVSINRFLTYLWNSLCHWSVKIDFWPTFEFHWNSSCGVFWLVNLMGLFAQINLLECSNYIMVSFLPIVANVVRWCACQSNGIPLQYVIEQRVFFCCIMVGYSYIIRAHFLWRLQRVYRKWV